MLWISDKQKELSTDDLSVKVKCLCVWERDRERETEKERGRERDRNRLRERERSRDPNTTKNRATSIPTPGHTPRENHKSKRYIHPHVHNSMIYNNWEWKQPKYPSTEHWIKEICTIWHILSHKRGQNWVICRGVDGHRGYHTKQKSYKDMYVEPAKNWYR